ncbi:hypothetical protein LTR85_007299 [Meristemomyces frigidus]|nr:hypothetical protein LTR85_007299 [Meristemomyces frigidus]
MANANENGNELPPVQPAIKPDTMSVTFRDQAGYEVQFRLKETTKLGKAMDHFSAKSERDRQTLRFLFEGQRVLPDSTMESCGMEDGDVVDVHLEQLGGGIVDDE